jgi:hypothetical protein
LRASSTTRAASSSGIVGERFAQDSSLDEPVALPLIYVMFSKL